MFWETIAAMVFILGTLPLWIAIAAIWGFVKAAIALVLTFGTWISASPIDWGEVWIVPVAAFFQGISSAWSIPSGMWIWAKFEHPVAAAVIGIFCMMIGGSRR